MTDYPRFLDLKGLAPAEHRALRSMSRACQLADGERRAAEAVASRLERLSDAVEDIEDATDGGPTSFSDLALHLAGEAIAWDYAVAQAACRYTTAFAVLGIAILDRLVHDRPPLAAGELCRLASEPSIAELRAALEIPVRVLLVRRGEADIVREEQRRAELVNLLRSVKFSLRSPDLLGNAPDSVLEAARISEAGSPKVDELWGNLLEPLMGMAEQTPYEISHFLRG